MKNSIQFTVTLAGVALALSLAPAARANLVVDGDFTQDVGQAPGTDGDAWTLTGNTGFNGSDVDGPVGPSENAWDNGAVGSDAYLSQTLSTIAGDEYSIGFWLLPGGVTSGDLALGNVEDDEVSWDGVQLFDYNLSGSLTTTTTGGGSVYYVDGVQSGPIVINAWNFIVIDPMGSGSDLLQFGIRNDPTYDQITDIDVELGGNSITPINPFAAPDAVSSALLLGVGLLSVLGLRRQVKTVC